MKTRILLVEDDERLADLTAEYLRKNDFEVDIEARGDTAETRILDERPDLVILDVMLPGKDGFEVCRAVRAQYGGVILMLTARDEDFDQILGLELGADDYIAKPVQPRLLLARIKALLRRAPATPAAAEKTGAEPANRPNWLSAASASARRRAAPSRRRQYRPDHGRVRSALAARPPRRQHPVARRSAAGTARHRL
jgi:DNA-binding response OmpR family regulator